MFVYHPFNSILCFEFLVAFGFVFLGIYLFSVLGCWFSFLGSTRDPCEYQENHSKWIVITSRTLHQLTRRWIWLNVHQICWHVVDLPASTLNTGLDLTERPLNPHTKNCRVNCHPFVRYTRSPLENSNHSIPHPATHICIYIHMYVNAIS